jgi:hypothetical protein
MMITLQEVIEKITARIGSPKQGTSYAWVTGGVRVALDTHNQLLEIEVHHPQICGGYWRQLSGWYLADDNAVEKCLRHWELLHDLIPDPNAKQEVSDSPPKSGEHQWDKMKRIRPKIEDFFTELVRLESYDAHDWAAFESEVADAALSVSSRAQDEEE